MELQRPQPRTVTWAGVAFAAALILCQVAAAAPLSPNWELKLSTGTDAILQMSSNGMVFAVRVPADKDKRTGAGGGEKSFDISVHETTTGKFLSRFTIKNENVEAFVPFDDGRIAVLCLLPTETHDQMQFLFSQLKILGPASDQVGFEQKLSGIWGSLCESSDGKLLAAGGRPDRQSVKEPCVVRIWNTQTFGEEVSLLRKPQRDVDPRLRLRNEDNDPGDRISADVTCLAFSADDKQLLVGTYGPREGTTSSARIEAWSTTSWVKEANIIWPSDIVDKVRGNKQRNHIVWIPHRGTKIAWCEWGGQKQGEFKYIASGPVTALAGKAGTYAGLQTDSSIEVGTWEPDGRKWKLDTGSVAPNSLVLSEDGKWLVALGDDGRLMGWNLSETLADSTQQTAPIRNAQNRNEIALQQKVEVAQQSISNSANFGDKNLYYQGQRQMLAAYDEAVRTGTDPDSIFVSGNKTLSKARIEARTALLDQEARRAQELAEQGHMTRAYSAIEHVIEEAGSDLPNDALCRYGGIKGGFLAATNHLVEAEPLLRNWAAYCDSNPNGTIDYTESHVGLAEVELGLGQWAVARDAVKRSMETVEREGRRGGVYNVDQRIELGRILGRGAQVLYQIAWMFQYQGMEVGKLNWIVEQEARRAISIGTTLLMQVSDERTKYHSIGHLSAYCAYEELRLGHPKEASSLTKLAQQSEVHAEGPGVVDDSDFAVCQLTALGISPSNRATSSVIDSAVTVFDRVLGLNSAMTISARLQQQLLAAKVNVVGEEHSLPIIRDCGQRLLQYANNDLRNLDEWRQFGLLRQALSDDFYFVLSFAWNSPEQPSAVSMAAEWLLNFKGRSLENQMRHTELIDSPNVPRRFDDPHVVNWMKFGELQQHIGRDEAYIDVIRYCPFDAQLWKWRTSRYLMFVATREAIFVHDLGASSDIDREVGDCRQLIANSTLAVRQQGEVRAEKELMIRIGKLSRLIFGELNGILTGKQRWTISPDGMLWFFPWESLTLDGSTYVVEQHSVDYTESGREILQSRSKVIGGPPVIIAAPNYDSFLDKGVDAKPNDYHRWLPLKGSLNEAADISPYLAQYTGMKVSLFTGDKATESELRQLRAPAILVLSTHAGQVAKDIGDQRGEVQDVAVAELASKSQSSDESRWEVALAGANRAEQRPDHDNDGLLTVPEIVALDLRGTELVVLSACDTGVGDYQSAESPLDIRRAFRIAGAEAVVASLWKVPDAETEELMTAFFAELSKGNRAAEALQLAQCKLINQRRVEGGAAHPLFWAAFTITGKSDTDHEYDTLDDERSTQDMVNKSAANAWISSASIVVTLIVIVAVISIFVLKRKN